MANLSKKIEKHLERKLNFDTDVVLQNDGGETYIKEWNVAEEQPELEDLDKIDVTTEVALAEALSNRQAEYPSIDNLVVSLFDTDDKAAIDAKRAAGKTKWPKDNSGPV